jgi:hypothetical protein
LGERTPIEEGFVNYIGWQQLLFLAVGGIIIVIPLWKVFSKAGYPGALSLGMMLPLLNIALLYFLGFSEWPVLKELKALRVYRAKAY